MEFSQAIQQRPLQRFKRLIGYVRPYRPKLLLAFLCLLVSGGLGLIYPVYFGKVIDAAFTHKDLSQLNRNALLLIILFGIQAAFVFFRYYLVAWIGERVVANLRGDIYRHIVTLPLAFFHRTRTGAILSRLTDDVSRVQSVVGTDLSTTLRSILSFVGIMTILIWTNPKLTGIMLGMIPPLILISRLWGRTIRRHSRSAHDVLAHASGAAQEGMAAIDTVQAFTRENHEVRRYQGYIEKAFTIFVRRARVQAWFFSTAIFLAFSSIAGIFWMGGRMVAQGEISPGGLTQFMLYTIMIAETVGSMANLWGHLSSALGATGRIFEILDEPSDITDPPGAMDLEDGPGRIEFDNVSFAYKGRAGSVVRQVSFSVEPGTVCALVGPSGSGKTTVARLLLRFYDPQAGEIRLDGSPIHTLTLASLRGEIAVVAQEAPLFSGTIRDNILYGRLTASDKAVKRAARLANADEFIMQLPQAYDTRIGERGVTLSGGQRQRIAIARAMLRDPRILILDEATNALDAESEKLVQTALESVQSGRTTLVVAHRLSTIRHADTIVVMDQGEIVERGAHDALMAGGGPYAHLVALQSREAP